MQRYVYTSIIHLKSAFNSFDCKTQLIQVRENENLAEYIQQVNIVSIFSEAIFKTKKIKQIEGENANVTNIA